ncbi:MAG: endonuclease/exonuclease/phosphatase family protein [Chloroflexi bacterium]|nr:endonuclease/exonuclease/phosphatase family protein [Chloroflexota bacterium]MBI2983814.1 endonuclease/exonuclease/phosphatase family protein [Chloroflexota bacterium]
MNGAILGETTFAALGILFLLSAIRTFTSTLYMSLYGNVANETVGTIALGVFAASLLAAVAGWRLGPRRSIALSGTLLVGATILSTASRWNWADITLAAVAVIGGTWWLSLTQAARSGVSGSAFVAGLPLALAADLAMRSIARTIPVVDLSAPVAIALTIVGALVFLAAGIAAYARDLEWTSPGTRGAAALLAIPPLILVSETGALNPTQAAVAGGLALGPEPAGSWYVVAGALGLGLTTGLVVIGNVRPPRQVVGLLAMAVGATLLWAHIPVVSTLGAMVLAAGVIVAAAVLPDTAARPAGSPFVSTLALGVGWVAFVALAFLFYAYYALPAAVWIATGLVGAGLIAALPLRARRSHFSEIAAVAVLAIVVPLVALLTPPQVSQATSRASAFRLMTYNVHQGFDEGNIPALDRITDVIRAEDPDVVVLQEVARGWMITQQHDVLTVLAERLGMTYVWGPAIGDAYGNAVLSRVPVSEVRYLRYERQPQLRHQPRGAILFTVNDVLVIATHLDHISGATEVRQGQVHAILAAWNGVRPAIVAGDLNALPDTPEMRLLEDAGFRDLAKDDGAEQPTAPSADPRNRVDYVWGIGVTGSQAHTVATTASDHRPLVVNIARR